MTQSKGAGPEKVLVSAGILVWVRMGWCGREELSGVAGKQGLTYQGPLCSRSVRQVNANEAGGGQGQPGVLLSDL